MTSEVATGLSQTAQRAVLPAFPGRDSGVPLSLKPSRLTVTQELVNACAVALDLDPGRQAVAVWDNEPLNNLLLTYALVEAIQLSQSIEAFRTVTVGEELVTRGAIVEIYPRGLADVVVSEHETRTLHGVLVGSSRIEMITSFGNAVSTRD